MVVSRRSFVKRGSLLVLAAAVSLGSGDGVLGRDSNSTNSTPTPNDLSAQESPAAEFNYSKATFLPHLNTIFRIHVSSSKVITTTLVGVDDSGPVPDKPQPGRECFELKFRGTEALSKQNTYRIEHQTLGSFELFIVPAGVKQKYFYYVAVINRLND